MTVATTNAVNIYTANGTQTVFAFTYQILSDQNGNPQISTVQVELTGVVQTTGFTTLANADQETSPGGSVTFGTAPVAGTLVELLRNTPSTQNLQFPLESKISTPALETAFDKTCLLVQEAEYQLSQKPSFPNDVPGGILLFGTDGLGDVTTINPNTAGYALIDGGPGQLSSFQPVTSAAGGNLAGPTPAVNVAGSVPLWAGTDGRTLSSGAPPVQAGNVFTDNGPGLQPTFQSPPANIVQLGGSAGGPKPLLNIPTGLAVIPAGTTGATSWAYKIVAKDAAGTTITAGTAAVSIANGNATLSSTNKNILTWNALAGAASYDVYRSTAGGTPNTVGRLVNSVTTNTYTDIGGAGDTSTAPTSTTLVGEFWHVGNFTTDAPIVGTHARIKMIGNFVQQATHAITASTELLGGQAPIAAATNMTGAQSGQGLGGGQGDTGMYNGTISNIGGGGGGGNAGAGGRAGTFSNGSGGLGGQAYSMVHQLVGSGGGAARYATSQGGGVGGAGGGCFFLECQGNITLNANISANGGNGTAGAGANDGGGGGGSGGTIYLVCTGALTIAAVTLSAAGGNGGNGGSGQSGGGGGGGGGRVFGRCSGTLTNAGTVTVTGGASGLFTAGGSVAAAVGANGTSDILQTGYFVRTAP